MPTSAEIQNWLRQNPGATDAQIAAAARQYGVTGNQLSSATGVPLAQVQQRAQAVGGLAPPPPVTNAGASRDLSPYRAALSSGVTDDLIKQGIGLLNSGQLSPGDIASLSSQFGISPQDISRATGVAPQDIARTALQYVEGRPQGLQAPQLSSLASAILPLFQPEFLQGGLQANQRMQARQAGGLLSQYISGGISPEQAQLQALNSFGRNTKMDPSHPGTYLEQVGPDQWVRREGNPYTPLGALGFQPGGLPTSNTLPAWYQGPLQEYVAGLGGTAPPQTQAPAPSGGGNFLASRTHNGPPGMQQGGGLTPSQQQLAQYIGLVGQSPQAMLAGPTPELQLLDRLRQIQMMSPLDLSGLASAYAGVPAPTYGIPDFSTLALNMLGVQGITGQSLLQPPTWLTPANAAYWGQPAPYLTSPWIPSALGQIPGGLTVAPPNPDQSAQTNPNYLGNVPNGAAGTYPPQSIYF